MSIPYEEYLNEVVIMENHDATRNHIEEVLKSLGFVVHTAKNQDDAIELAEKKGARFFIVDIHMGRNQQQEGLDTLESLKSFDKNIFVGVLSSYPNRFRD